jgi:hypothetical protein
MTGACLGWKWHFCSKYQPLCYNLESYWLASAPGELLRASHATSTQSNGCFLCNEGISKLLIMKVQIITLKGPSNEGISKRQFKKLQVTMSKITYRDESNKCLIGNWRGRGKEGKQVSPALLGTYIREPWEAGPVRSESQLEKQWYAQAETWGEQRANAFC